MCIMKTCVGAQKTVLYLASGQTLLRTVFLVVPFYDNDTRIYF
jgi:hypothetical protein